MTSGPVIQYVIRVLQVGLFNKAYVMWDWIEIPEVIWSR